MTSWNRNGIALVAATLLSAHAWAGEGPAGHSHHSHAHSETFSAGEPGNPKKPAKTRPGDDGRGGREDGVRPGTA